MASSEAIRQRIRLFASLQAAHRALAREAHPSALGPLRREARNLLVRLQKLSGLADEDEASDGSPEHDAELASVDRILEAQTSRTLTILDSIEFSQLRAIAPGLVQKHPEELKGLVDVLLEGDLNDDKSLRTLEYLITLLSTDESQGRRQVVRDPAAITERLRERTRAWSPDTDVLVAERALENAVDKIAQGADLGEVRDRVRLYKEGLGRDLLHPPVLSAMVRYNAAMSNQIAAELEGIRSLEDLAAGLYDESAPEGSEADDDPGRVGEQLLRSPAYSEVVAAFGARLRGDSAGPGPASRIVGRLDLEDFDLEDLEAFDTAEESDHGWLIRATVTQGALLRSLEQVSDGLRELDLDPVTLAGAGSDHLRDAMDTLARKRFADSNYGEAFRLSELKRRNLGAKRSTEPEPESERERERVGAAAESGAGSAARWGIDLGMLPGQAIWVAFAVVAILGLFLLSAPSGRIGAQSTVPEAAVRSVSPFLDSGSVLDLGGHRRRFVGQLGPTWAFLGTPERREVARAIGEHYLAEGIPEVVLMDGPGHMAAEFIDGGLVAVTPRVAPAGAPSPYP
ncbi:MAG: hypothetical protein ACQGVK_01530 [Myxococcota bacterium]